MELYVITGYINYRVQLWRRITFVDVLRTIPFITETTASMMHDCERNDIHTGTTVK
jgi:hypothetical protein